MSGVNAEKAYQDFIDYCSTKIILYDNERKEIGRLFDVAIREAKNEAELALMRGVARSLGEKAMLMSAIYLVVNHPDAAKRIVMYDSIAAAIDRYLGVKKLEKRGRRKKRERKKLLPRD